MTSTRVLTWNIRSLRDDRREVVAGLRAIRADVVCLQEVPRFVLPSWRLRRLAREAGLRVAAYGRAASEVAVLVSDRVVVRRGAAIALPRTRGLHRRGVAVAELTVHDVDVVVASVHLGLAEGERVVHLDRLRAVVDDRDGLAVVAGDINETPTGAVWQGLGGWLVDAGARTDEPTFPSWTARRRIDGVFVDPAFGVVWCGVASPRGVRLEAATDHLPVVADLHLPADA